MAKKAARFGPELMRAVEKQVLLQTLDHLWREHLATLDHLRSVDRLPRLCAARPAERIQDRRVRALPVAARQPPPRGHRAARACGDSAAAAGAPAALVMGGASHRRRRPARTRWRGDRAVPVRRSRRRGRSATRQPVHLGQGRPQRALPLRLRQEIQAVPRHGDRLSDAIGFVRLPQQVSPCS